MSKPRIALLFGGNSPEREVSKASGASIYNTLLNLGYETVLIDPGYGTNQPKDEKAFFAKEDYTNVSDRNFIEAVNSKLFDEIDLAFLALHGKGGEDGKIQSLLELRGIKYTGSKVVSSALSMDKVISKILFQYSGVNTPKWFSIDNKSAGKNAAAEMVKKNVGFPAVIKPSDQGSTVGLTICYEESQVEKAVDIAFQFSDKVLIEEYISGREITVGIIEDKALPVLEIKPKHGIYDYECKYTPGMSEYEVPAKLSKAVYDKAQEQSLLAFKALGCEGYGRVDFRVNEKDELYCLEINTLPGMTSTSLVPKMAKAVGISFDQLVERIINISL